MKFQTFSKRKEKTVTTAALFRWRYIFVTGVVVGATAFGLIMQMYRWQVAGHEKYSEMAQVQYLENSRLPTSRGTILASDGSVLAVDEPLWGVYASISTEERERERFDAQRDEFITTVSEILSVDEDELKQSLTEDFVYVPIKHGVTGDQKNALEEKGLFGLHFEQEEHRIYPQGSLASHILGFVGKDDDGNDVGVYGLEGYYAGDLLGFEGFKYEEKDSRGNVIITGEYDPVLPREGKNIELTIRPGLQSRVEESLKKGVEDTGAKSGSAIIMDPATGAILSMATYPTYNPNYYWKEKDASVFRNKAISDVYEYGSVNKVLTVSMAVEEGEITKDSICEDLTGSIDVVDHTIYTWDRRADGLLMPKDILRLSNNVCAVKVGQKVGIERMYEYLRKFGIGDFIGIGLQDEATSYLPPLEKWTSVDLATASFGQAISATPLQIISAISTIANDGVRMRPYIVDKIYDDTEVIDIEPEPIGRVISEETAHDVQEMMQEVVRDGDPKWWFDQIPNYSIAGKTGTAQIPYEDRYGYYDDRTNVTFVGFSPVHDAQMIMIVRLEEPKTNTLSAYTVVPVWIEIFKAVSLDLGIVPL
ncbi:MAG: penicillin-binding protein 2 [Candidatus Dojkabacteria bacterium]|nr:penicillin-binding protein 2 [Candidatus Dojkabacteria bacterium]